MRRVNVYLRTHGPNDEKLIWIDVDDKAMEKLRTDIRPTSATELIVIDGQDNNNHPRTIMVLKRDILAIG